jgi:hypothetical protein
VLIVTDKFLLVLFLGISFVEMLNASSKSAFFPILVMMACRNSEEADVKSKDRSQKYTVVMNGCKPGLIFCENFRITFILSGFYSISY